MQCPAAAPSPSATWSASSTCSAFPAASATARVNTHVAKLIERYGRDGRLVDLKDHITADCPRRANDRVALNDICGAGFPDLVKIFLEPDAGGS
jgi:hypothetical protein